MHIIMTNSLGFIRRIVVPYNRSNLIALWIASLLAAGAWQQVAPFLPGYLTELGAGQNLHAWSAITFSIHYISAFVFLPFWGSWGDRVGNKRLMVQAGFCLALLYGALCLATNPVQVVIIRLVSGAMTGFIPGGLALVAANAPRELAGKHVAALQTAGAAGMVFGPISGGVLADWFGYKGALLATAIMLLCATLLVIFGVHEDRIPQHKIGQQQERLVQMLRQPAFAASMLLMCLYAVATLSVQPILTLYLESLNTMQVNWTRGVFLCLPGLALMLTSTLWERQITRYRAAIILIPSTILAGVAALSIGFSSNIVLFAIAYFGLGVCAAGMRSGAATMVVKHMNKDSYGRAYTLQQWALMFGGFTGPLLAGTVGELAGTHAAFIFCGILLVLGAILLRRLLSPLGLNPVKKAA